MNSLTGAGIASLIAAIFVKIDKGIPVPYSAQHPVYPWREMAVGDSFKYGIPQHRKQKRSEEAIRASCAAKIVYANHKLYPKKFVCGKYRSRLRVWRVK